MRAWAPRSDAKELPSYPTASVSTDNARLEHVANYPERSKSQPVRVLAPNRRQLHCARKDGTDIMTLWGRRGTFARKMCSAPAGSFTYCEIGRSRDSTDAGATDKNISILYERYFNLDVLREEVKSHQDCQTITKDIIERLKSTSFSFPVLVDDTSMDACFHN